MTAEEFSNQFDVLYNNITSNQAPGLNEYEKTVFLTKAQNEIVKNYFTANSKGNNIGQGFDDSAKRQADFSCLMKTSSCSSSSASGSSSTSMLKFTCTSGNNTTTTYDITFQTSGGTPVTPTSESTLTVEQSSNKFVTTISSTSVDVIGWPFSAGGTINVSTETVSFSAGKIDDRSTLYTFPTDVFIVINETLSKNSTTNSIGKYQVIPLRYDDYTRLMSKPFKRPTKNQAWRLINSSVAVNGNTYNRYAEIIAPPGVSGCTYHIRYIRFPKPIIVGDLDGLSINGCYKTGTTMPAGGGTAIPGGCELDPIIHEDILQRAVELAKVAWTATGQDNAQMVLQAGQRSE